MACVICSPGFTAQFQEAAAHCATLRFLVQMNALVPSEAKGHVVTMESMKKSVNKLRRSLTDLRASSGGVPVLPLVQFEDVEVVWRRCESRS